jgi:hypothetical protein
MSYALAGPLQAAVFARLSSDAALGDLTGGNIFDAAPPGQLPPVYVSLGPEEARDRSDKTGQGAVHRFTISVISERGGFADAKAAAAAIETALTASPLALSQGRVVDLRFERAQARRERDGVRRRIDIRFRARVDVT